MLRLRNGAHAHYHHPIPPDWRDRDDSALWRYCEQAMP